MASPMTHSSELHTPSRASQPRLLVARPQPQPPPPSQQAPLLHIPYCCCWRTADSNALLPCAVERSSSIVALRCSLASHFSPHVPSQPLPPHAHPHSAAMMRCAPLHHAPPCLAPPHHVPMRHRTMCQCAMHHHHPAGAAEQAQHRADAPQGLPAAMGLLLGLRGLLGLRAA